MQFDVDISCPLREYPPIISFLVCSSDSLGYILGKLYNNYILGQVIGLEPSPWSSTSFLLHWVRYEQAAIRACRYIFILTSPAGLLTRFLTLCAPNRADRFIIRLTD